MWMSLNCYTMFILGRTEFCVQAWLPYFIKDIDCMEKVQRRATKMVYGFWNLKYEERLERLQYRKMRSDVIETYKIISSREDVNWSQFLLGQVWTISVDTAWNCKEHFRKVIRKEFISQTVSDQWNGLPEEVVKAKTLNSFKNSLDKYWRRYRH